MLYQIRKDRVQLARYQHVRQTSATGVQNLSAAERTKGTTQPLTNSDRNQVVRGEAVQPRSGVEAYTPRGLSMPAGKRLVQGHAAKDKNEEGETTVTIQPAQARRLGLLGPHEPDRSITTRLSKSEADQLGLASPGSSKRHITATAWATDIDKANDAAKQAVSHI